MTVAYDMDGVLAESPPESLFTKPWMRMNGVERKARSAGLLYHYARANPLFNPPEETFWVISARKHLPEVNAVTEEWLQTHFKGRVLGFRLLFMSRSIENVVAFKSHVLRSIGAVEFTEDNKKVLKGVALTLPQITLHYFDGRNRSLFR